MIVCVCGVGDQTQGFNLVVCFYVIESLVNILNNYSTLPCIETLYD